MFVWRPRDCAIVWANSAGLALWGAPSLEELAGRRLDRSMPALARLRGLALVLGEGASDRHNLVFWFPSGSQSLSCVCRNIRQPGEDLALLIEVAGPREPERTNRETRAPLAKSELNGHAPPARGADAPMLAPQDAATLAEIARIIRQKSTGNGNRPPIPPSVAGPEPAAASELARNEPEFLGQLSHELRTPLNAIIGYGELLQSEQSGPLGSPKYRAYTDNILEAARHCLSLVNDLFDMTRLAAGGRKLDFSEVDVNESVRASLAIVAPIAAKAGVALSNDLGAGLPLAIVDRRGLRQILLNLLANAVKFTPLGGQVSIATHYEVGVGLAVIVADTGKGMTAGGLDAARGLPVDDGLAGSGVTGLGLPISRALAAANGASLTVESQQGSGTRVTLFVPMNRLLLR